MKKYLYIIMALNFLLFSCSNLKETDNKNPEVIGLTEVLKKSQKAKISKIAHHIEYIQLETNETSLIGKNMSFFANDIYLLSIAFRQILLFDRKTGNFIREIGEYGKSPDSYNSTLNILPFNEERNTVYAGGSGEMVEYSLDGKIVNSVKLPPMTFANASIDESHFAGFVPNFFGKAKIKLNIFTYEGTITKGFPNYMSAPVSQGMTVFKPNGWFHRWDKQLYFYELFNDTLFQVTPNELIPRFVFNMGEYLPPYEKQTSQFASDKYFMLNSIYESAKFLFYSFRYEKESYTAVYDKKEKEVLLSDYSDETESGFTNDIDDCFSFSVSSVNNNNELIGFVEAYNVVQWFNENQKKTDNIPLRIQKLKKLNEMDNPVVMIAKLKD